MSLTITWLGHACFLITSSDSTSILLDPMTTGMGYDLPDFGDLDATLVTHLHRDHNYVQAAPVGTLALFGLNENGHFQAIKQQLGNASVYNVAAYHDDSQGSIRGEDALWVVDIDGLRLVHMGDFGQPDLTEQQLTELGSVDVLLMPVGGTYTVDGETARHIVAQLQPAMVIPMHYKTAALPDTAPHQPVDVFLGQPAPADAPHSITVSKGDLTAGAAKNVVMSYK